MIKKSLAFIPARGGSKRLKHKNILHFDGLPLIVQTINFAINSNLFNKVVVSTDDKDIGDIALNAGAKVVFRPMKISGDLATTSEALIHTYQELLNTGEQYDALVTLQTTNPFRTFELLQNCLNIFYSLVNYDSLITVNENLKKLATIVNKEYKPINYITEQRSQDLDKLYFENGLIYITNPKSLIEKRDMFGERIFPYIVDDILAYVDIDTKEEFELAEKMYQLNKEKYS